MKNKIWRVGIMTVIISLLSIQCINASVWASSPVYSCESIIRDDTLTDDYEYKMNSGDVQKKPNEFLLMINGNFMPEKVLIRNNRALVSVKAISEAYNLKLVWDEINRTAIMTKDNNIVKLKADSATAIINEEEVLLDAKTEILYGRMYAQLGFLAQAFNKSYGFLPAYNYRLFSMPDTLSTTNIGIAYHPVVWIDESNNANYPTDIESWLKQELLRELENQRQFLQTPNLKFYKDMDKTFVEINLNEVKQRIDNLRYMGSLGRYQLFAGPYIILVEPVEKKIYFYKVAHALGTIQQVDIDGMENFSPMYLFD